LIKRKIKAANSKIVVIDTKIVPRIEMMNNIISPRSRQRITRRPNNFRDIRQANLKA